MNERVRVRNIATAPIMVDGVIVGTITCGDADDVSPNPLGSGFAFGPAPAPSAFPQHFASREMPGRDVGGGHQPSHGTQPHTAPHRHLAPGHHDGEHHHRFLTPEKRGDQERKEQSAPHRREYETPIHKPHGDAGFAGPPEEKIEIPRSDAAFGGPPEKKSISPGAGIDRDWQRRELEANPALKEKLFRHSLGENTDPVANQAVMEEAANRADIRGQLRGGGGMASHGNLSYFQGYHRGNLAPHMKMLEENYRKVFVEGSDVSRGAIDNSSGSLARHEVYGGGKFPRPGGFTNTFNAGGRNGDNRVGAPGVESFHAPGYAESGTGEREFYPNWRERQLETARGRSTEPTFAKMPYHEDLERNRQLNRDAVERARHFSHDPLKQSALQPKTQLAAAGKYDEYSAEQGEAPAAMNVWPGSRKQKKN